MTDLRRRIFKNRYVYFAIGFAEYACRYGLGQAIKKVTAKQKVADLEKTAPLYNVDAWKRLFNMTADSLIDSLKDYEIVVIEPDEVLITGSTVDTAAAREDMPQLVDRLVSLGKQVYISVGDREKYERLLNKCGYRDLRFGDIKGAPHIANRADADIFIASPAEMFKLSRNHSLLERYMEKNEQMRRLIIDRGICSSPFCLDDRGEPVIKSFKKLGYCVYAPLLYDFTAFVLKVSEAYDSLWFLAREGWFLKQLFEYYGGNKEKIRYLFTSRRAASVSTIKNNADIREITEQYYRGSFKNMLYARFGIETDNEEDIALPEEIDSVMELMKPYYADIILLAEREREEYLSYIGDISGRIAVVDVGYRGTIQYYLSKLTGRSIDGIYITSYYANKLKETGGMYQSLAPVRNIYQESRHPVYQNHLYLEAVLKAPYGQLVCFNESQPRFLGESEMDSNIEMVQSGILEFFKDCCDMPALKSDFSAEFFGICIKSGWIDESIRSELYVEDSYCSDGEQRFRV